LQEPLAKIKSKDYVPIRITQERWLHVVEHHDYMAGNLEKVIETIEDPDYLVAGSRGEKLALRCYSETPISEKHVVAVYKEVNREDGFLITAFMTSQPETILKKGVLWQKRSKSQRESS
jgi:hypothetical protein